MAVGFAVSDIIERVRIRCALPAFSSETNISTAAILSIVQESARDLSALMNERDSYFVSTSTLSTVAGVPYISLPLNFAALQRLVWLKSATEVIPLDPANLEDVHPTQGSDTWVTRLPTYRITGQVIEFFPKPEAIFSLELRYSTGAFLASAADTLMGQIGWDTWCVYNACCIVCQSQDKEYARFADERDRKFAEIQRTAGRDKTGVVQPRDVRAVSFDDDPAGRWWKQ